MTFRVEIPSRRQINGGAWVEGSFHAFAATAEEAIAALAHWKAEANNLAGREIIVDIGEPIVTEISMTIFEAEQSDPSPEGYWPDLGIGVDPNRAGDGELTMGHAP